VVLKRRDGHRLLVCLQLQQIRVLTGHGAKLGTAPLGMLKTSNDKR
jgi:hypothetical protein